MKMIKPPVLLMHALISILLITQSACEPETGEPSPPPTKPGANIEGVYLAQTHVQDPDDALFKLVSEKAALIKVHVVSTDTGPAPAVTATLQLGANNTLTLPLSGPGTLPSSIPTGPGVVQHTYNDSFTALIPAEWVRPGLSLIVKAADKQLELNNLKIGAPSKVIMTMFDMHYFQSSPGDYKAGWKAELEAKWPVAELELRRIPNIVFNELVIPPRPDVSAPAVRVVSKQDYTTQTELSFDGEQAAALHWVDALKAAAGTGGRISLYYVNIYGVNSGGQAGGYSGVGNGTHEGVLSHELGHALSLPHWGGNENYPYKGDMHGIPATVVMNGNNIIDDHVGPTWAFDLPSRTFIPPTVQPNSTGGPPKYILGNYKADPMQGGGTGDQEQGFIFRHFSDYSVNQMRQYLEDHVLTWNQNLNSYARWNDQTQDYTSIVSNNGVRYPIQRDVSVVSIMAAVSAVPATPQVKTVSMVYPPIGPYIAAGIIDLFDPNVASDRARADSDFCPTTGCDVSLRIVQGGIQKTYMLAVSWDPLIDRLDGNSLKTRAVNLRASDGDVTKVDLLLTPDAEKDGMPASPQILSSWGI